MTLTPVALVKASSRATNASSSACTKYFHRSIASWAFFSGFHGAVCAHALAHSSSAGPASAPAAAAAVVPFTRVRRVKSVMMVSSVLGVEAFAGRLVEQVNEARAGLEAHAVAWFELMALAEHREHVLTTERGDKLGFRAGRLDHLDFRIDAVVRQNKVLGAHTVDGRRAVRPFRRPLRG